MNYAKTALLLVIMAALLIWIGGLIGGPNGALIALVIALVINGASYWFSDKIVLKMYNAREIGREEFPRIYEIVDQLSQNAGIPSPRVFMTDIKAPNAFATGIVRRASSRLYSTFSGSQTRMLVLIPLTINPASSSLRRVSDAWVVNSGSRVMSI